MSRAEGFAPIPTWMIRDADVSIYALTVYAALSSRSGLREIIPGRDTLAREARCSVRQVARALAELEELGVVRRARRKSTTGRAPNGYTLHPNGLIPVEDSQSHTPGVEDSHDLGKGLGEQGFGTEAASTPSIRQKELGRESEAESLFPQELAIAGPTFDDFWSAWPRKDARKAAEAAWVKAITRTPAAQIVDAARAFASSPYRPENKFVPHGSTWLNQDRWTDPLPEAPPTTHGRTAPDDRFRDGLDRGARLAAMANSQQKGVGA